MSYNKSYYETHKKNVKTYRQNNLEYCKEYQRLWYQKKRYHINCVCGSKYLKHNEINHLKTQKHKRGLSGVRPTSKKPKIKKPKEKEEQKIIPYKTIFVSKNKILWSLQL